MSMSQTVKKKKAVSGWINPRWPKERVAHWLEIGTIPAVVGLWLPDWVGAYAGSSYFNLPAFIPPLPPLVTYVGALILLKASFEGIRNMGYHFKGLLVSGGLALSFAALSLVVQLLGFGLFSLALTGLAAFFAVGYLWFTVGKVWEITQEKRTQFTWHSIWIGSMLTLGVYLFALWLLFRGESSGYLWLRVAVGLLTVVFFLCRYGVYCYKTQTSIGARFQVAPDDQFWIGAVQ